MTHYEQQLTIGLFVFMLAVCILFAFVFRQLDREKRDRIERDENNSNDTTRVKKITMDLRDRIYRHAESFVSLADKMGYVQKVTPATTEWVKKESPEQGAQQ